MSTTLITGASGGLGAEFARLAAAERSDLLLVARTETALATLAADLRARHGIRVDFVAADLSTEDGLRRVREAIVGRDIDTLINNAGVGSFGPFATQSDEDISTMLRLNVESLTLLTRLLLPGMMARKRGRILNVASTAAFQPGPLLAVYYASKAYVLQWSLALSNELAGTGVTVTCLCPGPVRTGFQRAAGMAESPLFKAFHVMDAETVARKGYDAMKRGKPLVTPGFFNALGAFGTRLIPRTWAAAIARKAQE